MAKKRGAPRHHGTAVDLRALVAATDGPVDIRVEAAEEETARLLDIDLCEDVLVRERVPGSDGAPVAICRSWLPRAVTVGTVLEEPALGRDGITGALRMLGYWPLQIVQHVGARRPTPAERTTLRLPEGRPVLTVTRVVGTEHGALEVDDVVLRADRYTLRYRWTD